MRVALVCGCVGLGLLAGPLQADKLRKSSRAVIRIDIDNGVQANRASRQSGVRVASGDVTGDGTADGAPKPKPKPKPPTSDGGRKSPPSESISFN